MSYLLLLAISFSFCYLLVTSKIFSGIRNYFIVKAPIIGDFLSCIQCVGFWSGSLVFYLCYSGVINLNYSDVVLSDYVVVNIIIGGFMSSLFSVISNSIIFFLNSRDKYIIVENKNENEI